MAARKKHQNKTPAKKTTENGEIWSDSKVWLVKHGELKEKKKRGRPLKKPEKPVPRLFKVVGEKLPFEAMTAVRLHIEKNKLGAQGVYIAHDSMGCPRYIGRGNIFSRLEARKKAQPLELRYFSFYVVSTKKHEREIESLLIRAASFSLEFNEKKKRVGISAGNVRDYEAGTRFYERQKRRGKQKRKKA